MANSYYEAHITLLGNSIHIENVVNTLRWKFSKIDGDASLGSGIKCYATKHFNVRFEKEFVLKELFNTANILKCHGFEIVRRKIELVIYDDRSNTIRFNCNGNCPECHMDDLTRTT